MEGVEHGDGIGELVADGVRVAAEPLQGGVLDAGGELLALLDQPAGVDGAGAAGVVSAMDGRGRGRGVGRDYPASVRTLQS